MQNIYTYSCSFSKKVILTFSPITNSILKSFYKIRDKSGISIIPNTMKAIPKNKNRCLLYKGYWRRAISSLKNKKSHSLIAGVQVLKSNKDNEQYQNFHTIPAANSRLLLNGDVLLSSKRSPCLPSFTKVLFLVRKNSFSLKNKPWVGWI